MCTYNLRKKKFLCRKTFPSNYCIETIYLSREELEKEEIKQAQNDVSVSVDSKHSTMGSGIQFPLSKEAENAMAEFVYKRVNYLQLSIDVKRETIELATAVGSCSHTDLQGLIPRDKPRYHVFNFKHNFEGASLNSPSK